MKKSPFDLNQNSNNIFGELRANPKRIRQARELAGMTQADLADRIGVSQGLVAQFEGALKMATREFIHLIAAHTRYFKPSFFYTEPLIDLSSEMLMFRAAASMSRAEETEARRYTEIACEMACVLLDRIKPIQFALNFDNRLSPAAAAHRVREQVGVPGTEPIPHLARMIERSGVLLLSAPMDLGRRDALCVRSQQVGMPVIVLFGKISGDRIRLSAAHELGHIVLKHSHSTRAIEEKQAFEFASELLMPEAAMRREMSNPVTLSSLASLKSRWRVSIQALIHRGSDLGILNDSRARYLYTQISVKGWRKHEPVEIPVERPRLMRQLFEKAYGENYEAFANDLGLRPQFVRQIMECFEGRSVSDRPVSGKVVALRRM